jgi:hypothetical protein
MTTAVSKYVGTLPCSRNPSGKTLGAIVPSAL